MVRINYKPNLNPEGRISRWWAQSSFVVWIFLMMLSGVRWTCCCPFSNRHKDGLYVRCCDDFSEAGYTKLFCPTSHGFRKMALLSSQWFQVRRVREKMEVLVRGVVARYWKKRIEFMIWFSLQVKNKTSTTIKSAKIWYPQRCITET